MPEVVGEWSTAVAKETKLMNRVTTTLRCVPRLGLDHTGLRVIDIDIASDADDRALFLATELYFAQRSIADAIFDIDYDDDGPLAIINDEAYLQSWGEAVK
jgi:hypothetical protein